MKNDIILKLNSSNSQQASIEGVNLTKVISSISPLEFIRLLNVADNKVNPRAATANNIVKAIHETLKTSPELFWFKTKGILLASENCVSLDRNRIGLTLSNDEYEGIMDGGHNTFAIASYIISELLDIKVKHWQDCKTIWKERYDEILELFKENKDNFPFSIPIEIIAPDENDGAIEDFHDHISEICSARNNNVQLKETAKANQTGTYDYIKKVLEGFNIIWKTGQPGLIKSEDVLSISSISLFYLQEKALLPESVKKINKINIYSGKSMCVNAMNDILSHKNFASHKDGKYTLDSDLIKSALDMSKDLIMFFDRLYLSFPAMYNRSSGSFGRIGIVKNEKPSKVPFLTTDEKCGYTYPPAYIYPLFAGVTSLMKYDEDTNTLSWRKNPLTIDLEELDLTQYVNWIKVQEYDPQKVGKKVYCYNEAEIIFDKLIK